MKKIKFITAALFMLSFISCGNANTSTKPSDEAISNKTDVQSTSANLTTDPTAELEKAQKALKKKNTAEAAAILATVQETPELTKEGHTAVPATETGIRELIHELVVDRTWG